MTLAKVHFARLGTLMLPRAFREPFLCPFMPAQVILRTKKSRVPLALGGSINSVRALQLARFLLGVADSIYGETK
jgi:hypothetical protein